MAASQLSIFDCRPMYNKPRIVSVPKDISCATAAANNRSRCCCPLPHLDEHQNYMDQPEWDRLYLWIRLRGKSWPGASVQWTGPWVLARVVELLSAENTPGALALKWQEAPRNGLYPTIRATRIRSDLDTAPP